MPPVVFLRLLDFMGEPYELRSCLSGFFRKRFLYICVDLPENRLLLQEQYSFLLVRLPFGNVHRRIVGGLD